MASKKTLSLDRSKDVLCNKASFIQCLETNIKDSPVQIEQLNEHEFVCKAQGQEQVKLSHDAQGELEISAPILSDATSLTDTQIELMIESAVDLNQTTGQTHFDMAHFSAGDAVKVYRGLQEKGLTPVLTTTQAEVLQSAAEANQGPENPYQAVLNQADENQQQTRLSV